MDTVRRGIRANGIEQDYVECGESGEEQFHRLPIILCIGDGEDQYRSVED